MLPRLVSIYVLYLSNITISVCVPNICHGVCARLVVVMVDAVFDHSSADCPNIYYSALYYMASLSLVQAYITDNIY